MPWRVLEVEVSLPSMMLEKVSNWTLVTGFAPFVLESLVAEGAMLMYIVRGSGALADRMISEYRDGKAIETSPGIDLVWLKGVRESDIEKRAQRRGIVTGRDDVTFKFNVLL